MPRNIVEVKGRLSKKGATFTFRLSLFSKSVYHCPTLGSRSIFSLTLSFSSWQRNDHRDAAAVLGVDLTELGREVAFFEGYADEDIGRGDSTGQLGSDLAILVCPDELLS